MTPELLMPAGDLEKAKIAYQFGADACYGSTSSFSMRTREIGFDYKTLQKAINYAHSIGKKFYVTLNIYPHEFELAKIKAHAKKLIKMNPDAIIVADPGILAIVVKELKILKNEKLTMSLRGIRRLAKTKQSIRKNLINNIELHLSTQANATNSEAIKFWASQGISRIILAREVSLKEIKEIRKKIPNKIVLEAFVHGAMCNSVSGRCNLSNYLSFRDANRGACVQACRWKYALIEEKRPNQYIPIEEDEKGAYIFNSRDLCMIEHLEELKDAGIGSFKVEGRNKSIYYCAIVARAYRKMIDLKNNRHSRPDRESIEMDPRLRGDDKLIDQEIDKNNNEATAFGGVLQSQRLPFGDAATMKQCNNELLTVTSRGYSTGFYFGKPTDADIDYKSSRPTSAWQFVGIVKGKTEDDTHRFSTLKGHGKDNERTTNDKRPTTNHYLIECRNEILPNTTVEIVTPNEIYRTKLKEFVAEDGDMLPKANPNMEFILESKYELPINSMMRSKISESPKIQ